MLIPMTQQRLDRLIRYEYRMKLVFAIAGWVGIIWFLLTQVGIA